jgi:hypothetical protein
MSANETIGRKGLSGLIVCGSDSISSDLHSRLTARQAPKGHRGLPAMRTRTAPITDACHALAWQG